MGAAEASTGHIDSSTVRAHRHTRRILTAEAETETMEGFWRGVGRRVDGGIVSFDRHCMLLCGRIITSNHVVDASHHLLELTVMGRAQLRGAGSRYVGVQLSF